MNRFILVFFLTLPFLVNDYIYPQLGPFENILLVDYVIRIVVIGAILYFYDKGDLGLKNIRPDFLLVSTLILALIGYYFFGVFRPELSQKIEIGAFIKWDFATELSWKKLDQFLGVFVIAFSEELLFRGAYSHILRKLNPNIIVFLTSLIYASIYWGLGPSYMIVAFMWGLISHISYFKIKNLTPLILAHYIFKILIYQ